MFLVFYLFFELFFNIKFNNFYFFKKHFIIFDLFYALIFIHFNTWRKTIHTNLAKLFKIFLLCNGEILVLQSAQTPILWSFFASSGLRPAIFQFINTFI